MHRPSKPVLFAFGFTCCLISLSYVVFTDDASYLTIFGSLKADNAKTADLNSNARQVNKDPRGICVLPKLEPWSPEHHKYIEDFGSFNCKATFEQLTSLENGTLRVNSGVNKDLKCRYRCHYPINDYESKIDDWTEFKIGVESRPRCDIVEVECSRNGRSIYSFMHSQIVEKPKTTEAPHSDYNVYWIIIDSVSMSMFKRAMVKTRDLLLDKFDAVEFPYLNKNGLNSRPNSYAMFLGEPDVNNETRYDQLCATSFDSLKYVGFDFQTAGYYTLDTEDCATSAFNWPNCTGFAKNHADHFMRPFWRKIGFNALSPTFRDPTTRARMLQNSCKQEHHYLLEQILQFAASYDGKAKFLTTWMTELAHNNQSFLFPADAEFVELFEKLNSLSKNSFIFFQGDHGFRYGKIREIPVIGELEDLNPFLYVVVPEKLRKNPTLMKQMRINAGSLVSHYDLYASAVQVAKFAHSWNETTNFDRPITPITDRNLVGSSIFHQMNQPRTCENIGIPRELCLCLEKSTIVNDTKLANEVAQFLIGTINQHLGDPKFARLCRKHTLSTQFPVEIEELQQTTPTERILKAKFETLPGHALYQATVKLHANQTISLLHPNFPRLDSYAKQATCIPEQFLRNYCVCHSNLNALKRNRNG